MIKETQTDSKTCQCDPNELTASNTMAQPDGNMSGNMQAPQQPGQRFSLDMQK